MTDPTNHLRSSIDAAHAAADRLVQEATARAEAIARERNRDVPPNGWESPRREDEGGITPDLAAIMALLESVRGAVPDELSTQLAEALRELLLALRALIDWYIDRLEGLTSGRAPRDRDVEDIPIT